MPRRKKSSEVLIPGMQGYNMIGSNLRKLRKEASPPLSLGEFCALVKDRCGLDISPEVVSLIERGKRAAFDYEVFAFAKALQAKIDHLFDG